jgi:hypothetical protein
MCMSAYSTYHPRPVTPDGHPRPVGAPATTAELDANLFGPRPVPPEWAEKADDAVENHHGTNEAIGVQGAISSQQTGGVIVELADGTRLLICPV